MAVYKCSLDYWRAPYDRMVRQAAETAFNRMMRHPLERLHLHIKAAEGEQWGDLVVAAPEEDCPLPLVVTEHIPTHLTKEQLARWVRNLAGGLPLLGSAENVPEPAGHSS
jgi:hypothetical protein